MPDQSTPTRVTRSRSTKRRATRVAHADAPLRAVAYVRLSKAKASPGDTEVGLETQRAGCERAIAAMGGTSSPSSRTSSRATGSTAPACGRPSTASKAGEANAVIVYALDRFGRDQDAARRGRASPSSAPGAACSSATENLEEGPLGDFCAASTASPGRSNWRRFASAPKRGLTAKFRASRAATSPVVPGRSTAIARSARARRRPTTIDPAASRHRRAHLHRAGGWASIRSIIAQG